MRFASISATVLATAATIARAQLTPSNLVAASTSGSLSAIKYTKVGSTGSYDQVTDIIPGTFPTCDANPFCITSPKQVSGECRRPARLATLTLTTRAAPQRTWRRSTTR